MIPRAASLRFDGSRALEHVRQLVAMGPRSLGSPGHDAATAYIERTLAALGLSPQLQRFTAQTPDGAFAMTNVIAVIGDPLLPATPPAPTTAASPTLTRRISEVPREGADTVVLAAHYDTKRFPFTFVGANDGGSGTAALLEMARVLTEQRPKRRVALVFFDGEEAFHEWSGTDSIYGSRHLAKFWASQGVLGQIRAFVLMDMIGFSELRFMRDANSNRWLQNRIWQEARQQGRGRFFSDDAMGIEDDHIPFVEQGVPAAVLIDFQYGPNGTNTYWHTADDTLDKLSDRSLEIVGRVIEGTVREL